MEREDQAQRPSSLPSSLIPHLYSRPQRSRNSVPNSGTTNQPGYPVSPVIREEDMVSTNEQLQPTSFSVPLASAAPTAASGLPFIGGRGSPRFYSPYLPIDQEMTNQSSLMAMSVDAGMSAVRGMADTPNIPSTVQRYNNPIYSDPIYHTLRPSAAFRTAPGYSLPQMPWREQSSRSAWREWREAEPGPSSLPLSGTSPGTLATSHHLQRFSQQPETFDRSAWQEEPSGGFEGSSTVQTRGHRHSVQSGVAIPAQKGLFDSPPSQTIQELPPPHVLFPGSEAPSSVIYGRRHEVYPPSQDLSTSPAGRGSWLSSGESARSTSLLTGLPPIKAEPASPEVRNVGKVDVDDGSKPAQRSRRRRRDQVEADNRTRKTGNARKTAVACNFCRGRKLRCNGVRPICHNCAVRRIECEYVPMQRRRGPGKANKSSKMKKAQETTPEGREEQEAGSEAFNLDSGGPRQPYTSVMSLEKFTFQPPTASSSSPGHAGISVGPETEHGQPRSPKVDR